MDRIDPVESLPVAAPESSSEHADQSADTHIRSLHSFADLAFYMRFNLPAINRVRPALPRFGFVVLRPERYIFPFDFPAAWLTQCHCAGAWEQENWGLEARYQAIDILAACEDWGLHDMPLSKNEIEPLMRLIGLSQSRCIV
ncbi:MAG: hypothetical protein ACRER2_02870 [Methylococcales bacterium]